MSKHVFTGFVIQNVTQSHKIMEMCINCSCWISKWERDDDCDNSGSMIYEASLDNATTGKWNTQYWKPISFPNASGFRVTSLF